jgi:hypothetical protein
VSAGGKLTLDQESAVVYGNIDHRIVPRLYGNLNAQFQNSVFNGGAYDGKSEQYYIVGVGLQYRFDPLGDFHLSADAGYNYVKVDSDIGRGYDRNRVYIGVTASY